MKFRPWRSESLEEARKRRLCRKMLMLPPEPEYHHVLPGLATVGAVGGLLIAIVAWRLGHFASVAPTLMSVLGLVAMTATVLGVRRRYRHASAGFLVLAMLLSLLVGAVRHYGYPGPVSVVTGPTPSALANSTSTD